MKKPIILTILDGCGIREESEANAFKNAKKETFDFLWNKYPHTLLEASGTYVGLPNNQMGNSEVGHMNIGAGRVVYQPLELINKEIENKTFFENKEILNIINHVKENDSHLHIMGLLSDGGVHSHINHLIALVQMCKTHNVKVVYHLFLDGRDVEPKSALKYIKELENQNYGKIATISGRYYAMDRDDNFDRIKKSYDAICYLNAPHFNSAEELINKSYENDITDEFIVPGIINDIKIEDNDAVVTFNYRKDRLRELFTCFTNKSEYEKEATEKGLILKKFENVKFLTMLSVVDTVKCPNAFDDISLENILGKILEENNKTQLRIAETEKYAHVTYFLDGGKEENYEGMTKIVIPSPKVATYDLKPQMSVYEVTQKLLEELDKDIYDVVILNFANGDMVGHTGNYNAAVEAVEHMDKCLKQIYDKIQEKEGVLIITADHGNCDIMWDENKKPVTSHTTSKVPLIITKENIKLKEGKLSDITPTLLKLLEVPIPKEMTSNILIKE